MNNEVFVTKTTLINLMGGSALKFAMFISGDTVEGKAFKVLFENIDQIDLNCDLVKNQLLPMLGSVGVFYDEDMVRIHNYIQTALS